MRVESIRTHLQPYRIHARRSTTVNHAFASAIAPADAFAIDRVRTAISLLGQDPDVDLACVYCGLPAETWDHLRGLVVKRNFSGYGHVLGNLVPSCKPCNSRKGSKDWRAFLESTPADRSTRARREALIAAYVAEYLPEPLTVATFEDRCPELMAEFSAIRMEVLALLARADDVAAAIRAAQVGLARRADAQSTTSPTSSTPSSARPVVASAPPILSGKRRTAMSDNDEITKMDWVWLSADAIEQFKAWRIQGGATAASASSYATGARSFVHYCRGLDKDPSSAIEDFYKNLARNSGITPRARSDYRSHARAFVRFLSATSRQRGSVGT